MINGIFNLVDQNILIHGLFRFLIKNMQYSKHSISISEFLFCDPWSVWHSALICFVGQPLTQWPNGLSGLGAPPSTTSDTTWHRELLTRPRFEQVLFFTFLHILLSISYHFLPLQKSRTSGWRFVLNISQPKRAKSFRPNWSILFDYQWRRCPSLSCWVPTSLHGTTICPTHSLRLPSTALLDCVCRVLVISYSQGPLPSRWMRRSWTSGFSIHAWCALHTRKMQSAKRRVFWNLAQILVM